MKLITRRILFCFCFILFLISSPLVILYAFGYRYDFAQKTLTQTGIIYLTPNIQDNLKILIDGKEEPDNTSVKGIFKKEFVLYNLVPKTYNIKIEKDNYYRWEKNLVVLPGITTYAQPLLLPSDAKASLIFSEADIPIWSISGKFKKIFFLKNADKKISANIYDFSKKTSVNMSIETMGGQLENTNIIPENSNIFLAPNGEKFGFVLAQSAARIILFNSNEKNISPIADFISNDLILNGQWDDSSRFFLYLNEKRDVYAFDSMSKKSNKILENVASFSLKGDDIYYLNQDNLFLYRSNVNNPLEKQQLSYAPLAIGQENSILEKNKQASIGKKSTLIISSKNTSAVITPEKNLFSVPQSGIPVKLGSNIESAMFSKDGENIVFNSSYEIFTNSLSDNQEYLVTRLSQKISNVSWHSDYEHLWFLANQTIKNIELDSRPTPNIIDFFNIPDAPANIVYTDSNSIYYDQKIDGILSFYQIEIQKP